MADKYVWSGATGAADGSSWTDAYTTISAGIAGAGGTTSGGFTVHVASDHSESITVADENWDGETSIENGPTRIVSEDRSDDSYLPATSAQVTLTSTYDLNIDGNFAIYGLRIAATGSGYVNPQQSSGETCLLQDCYFDGASGSPSALIRCFALGCSSQFVNCTMALGSTSETIDFGYGVHTLTGCTFTSTSSGSYVIGILAGCNVTLIGCDFSGTNASNLLGGTSYANAEVYGCRLASGMGMSASTRANYRIYETDTDSGNDSYRNEKRTGGSQAASIVSSTARSGGATYDGTNGYSYVLSLADVDVTNTPNYTDWNTGFLSNTGERTFTVYIANATQDMDDTECWLELEYFGSASNTLKTIATDGETDPTVAIGSGTVQTDDTTSTWSPAKTYMQKLEVTVTIARPGSFRFRVGSRVATDIYIDPVPEIT